MKTIGKYITEELDQKDAALWSYLKRKGKLEGNEIKLRKFARSIDKDLKDSIDAKGNWIEGDSQFNREFIPREELDEFLNWAQLGPNAITIDFGSDLIRWFGKKGKLAILKEYIMVGYESEKSFNCADIGCATFGEFLNENKNIFELINKKWKGEKNWQDVAEQIAVETNVKNKGGSSTIGDFELLFKFIIKSEHQKEPGNGDVTIDGNGIEIKASRGKNGGSGAIMKTRKSTAGYKNFYKELNDKLAEIECNDCFKNMGSIDKFLGELKKQRKQKKGVYKALVHSSAALYDVTDKESLLSDCYDQIKNEKFLEDKNALLNVLGWIQLNFYQIQNEFNYIVVFDDKGNYNWLAANNNNNNIPFKFNDVKERFSFKPMSDTGSCRIYKI